MSSSDDVVARRVMVHGRVQGVFYRDTCQRQASAHRVAGWVRNCADGTVEAWFEGAPDDVEAMVAWAGRGPRHAEVSDVSVNQVAPEGLSGFDVR